MSWYILLLLCAVISVDAQFEVPEAKVEVFTPRGLKVSIPDQEGIKLFAFHGNINKELNGREAGEMSRDITKAKNGRWTFYDPTKQLKVGDNIYYWTYVDYYDGTNKLGYPNDDLQFTVKELIPLPGVTTTTSTSTTTAPTPTPSSGEITNPPTDKCDSTPTTANGKPSCAGKIIFNDGFTNQVRRKFWNIEKHFADAPDYEFCLYGDHPQTLQVDKRTLKIRPVLAQEIYGDGFCERPEGFDFGVNCTGILGTRSCVQKPQAAYILPPVASSQITTKNKFSFKYGTVEIHAKLPEGDWIYPELYLTPANDEYGSGYDSGQIRVAFTVGNADSLHDLYGGIVLGTSDAARYYGLKKIRKNANWSNEFHRYKVTWTPERITLSVDNQVYGNIFPPEDGFASLKHNLNIQKADRWTRGSKLAPFDKEMYITLGVGVGGWNIKDRNDGSKPWINSEGKGQKDFYRAQEQWKATWGEKSALEIDYVKVTAL